MIGARDPIAKLLVGMLYLAVLTLSNDVMVPAIVGGAIALWLLLVERIAAGRFVKALLPFAFFALSSAWIYLLAPDAGYGAIHGTGWATATLVTARTMAAGLVAIAFALTTEPAALARALVARGRLPRRFVFGTLAAIQFVPALREEARIARLTARSALAPGSGRLRRRFAGIGPALGIVLLAGAVRRAGAAAISMELRGLGRARTYAWHVPRFGARDAVFIALALALLLLPFGLNLPLWR